MENGLEAEVRLKDRNRKPSLSGDRMAFSEAPSCLLSPTAAL